MSHLSRAIGTSSVDAGVKGKARVARHPDPDEVAQRRAAGLSWNAIAAELGGAPGALRQGQYRRNQKRGVSTVQGLLMDCLESIGLWASAGLDTDTLQPSHALVSTVKRDADTALGGIAATYVLTLPPELQLVYMNQQGQTLYGVSLADIQGLSYWEFMARKLVYERIHNLWQYHQAGVRVAKAILQIGEWLGHEERERALDTVTSYRQFIQSVLTGMWDMVKPDILALSSVFPGEVRHWSEERASLTFEVHWNYRVDWRLFLVTYEPRDAFTAKEMANLQRAMTAGNRLRWRVRNPRNAGDWSSTANP